MQFTKHALVNHYNSIMLYTLCCKQVYHPTSTDNFNSQQFYRNAAFSCLILLNVVKH